MLLGLVPGCRTLSSATKIIDEKRRSGGKLAHNQSLLILKSRLYKLMIQDNQSPRQGDQMIWKKIAQFFEK